MVKCEITHCATDKVLLNIKYLSQRSELNLDRFECECVLLVLRGGCHSGTERDKYESIVNIAELILTLGRPLRFCQ